MQQLTNAYYGWGLPCWSHGWLGVVCIAPALTHAHKEAGRCHCAALVDTGKLPIAPIANHRDMTTRSTAIPTEGVRTFSNKGAEPHGKLRLLLS